MKRLVIAVATLVFLFASIGALRGEAQENPFDVGEQNLLVVACNQVSAIAANEGLEPGACRRAAPEDISGNRATVHVKLYTSAYTTPFLIDVHLQKSLWTMHSLAVTG